MKTKKCSKCREVKSIEDFYKAVVSSDGYRNQCKTCEIERRKKYYKNNIEKEKKCRKKWLENNPEYGKNWCKNNSEKKKESAKKWRKNNLINVQITRRRRYVKFCSIPKNRLNKNISCLIWYSLKGNKNGSHWEGLVNYNLQDLITHLESLFKPGMTWQNMGKWHIDHIRPVSSFNFNSYSDPEFKKCWALDNLQPLWAVENIIKSNKFNL